MSLALPPRIADNAMPVRFYECDEKWIREEAERLGVPISSVVRALIHEGVKSHQKNASAAR